MGPECDHPLRVSVASHTNHILKMVVDKTLLLLFVIVFTQVMTSMSCRKYLDNFLLADWSRDEPFVSFVELLISAKPYMYVMIIFIMLLRSS